ncbi:UDP-xylose and UDP-N-acetylglucosamine transporter [Strongyloides ratti]|uniref:UDP-xylose and UDP-N-acetylglucosamine transporter n=1 Tax=Strongyloides ratti TaxID=34506 RepID=A0A090L153_STRRB|nr:UDP-xylose and UDP-N-acetylglucosamine transporter [Strongyloides ratti]CEF61842.1 UDP-xylose and UDP-N-acetylglucosamine transporter [Strongyloides ratti]
MAAIASIGGALGGCMGCMYFVESLAKEVPSSMNLYTFSSFLFVFLEGLIFTSKFFTVKNKIPIKGYIPVVSMFFFVNVVNNQALNFHVPVPLHIIFRSGSLLSTLIMNRLLMGRKYSLKKYLSVIAITIGIIICTLSTKVSSSNESKNKESSQKQTELFIGIVMLTVALIASSILAIFQEKLYKTYGKHPNEAKFVIHGLSLPIFLFMFNDITTNAKILSSTEPIYGIPKAWIDLIGACLLQYVCITFVYKLNSVTDSLTVTLVVTLRKFLSLLVSIFWFKNPFTTNHWIGALLVFGGTLVFSEVLGTKKDDKKKN